MAAAVLALSPPRCTTLVASSVDGKVSSGTSNARITSLSQQDAPADLPKGASMPMGLVSFTVQLAKDTTSESFSLYVDASLGINGYWKQDASGQWIAKDVADIGDPSKVPLPVDISITADGKGLWVNTFMEGKTRYFDMTDPEHPKETYSVTTGPQVNMVSQSWDGKRVYLTSSLLANWDKKGKDNEQVLRAFDWDGQKLTEKFEVDFAALKLGRAHHMKFSARPAGKTLAQVGNLSVAQAPQQ